MKSIHDKYPWIKKLADERRQERLNRQEQIYIGLNARRKAFLQLKTQMKEMRNFYYQFGQPSSFFGVNGSYEVLFESLHRGVKLEDIPTELNGYKVQVGMAPGCPEKSLFSWLTNWF